MDLKDAVIVVTGASRGLGALIATDLGRAGAHLVLAARDAGALEEVAGKVRGEGGQATVVTCDLARAGDRQRLVDAAEAVGPTQALINNAGIEIPLAIADQREEDIDRQIQINLAAPIHLTRAFLPRMIPRGRGAIVMVSSMSGKSATPYNGVYAATKHGLVGFTSSLRIELLGTGVHAGVVCPGFVAEAGMWSDTGLKAPATLREVRPQAVTAAVRKVLGGASEVLVTAGPIRPLLALAQLFPSLDARALRWMGVLRTLKDRAEVTSARLGRGASGQR